MIDGVFLKLDASGNEFLIRFWDEGREGPLEEVQGAEAARALCDRDSGNGADGLIVATVDPVGPPLLEGNGSAPGTGSMAAARMRLWNSDGSEAAVSGNCLRCLTHALARRWGQNDLEIWVDTSVGLRRCVTRVTNEPNTRSGIVFMEVESRNSSPVPDPTTADPALVAAEFVGNGGVERWGTVDVGNPHVVLAVAAPGDVQLDKAGPAVEELFPGGINVHFAALAGRDEITMRIWERGAGVTRACGTGAVAVAEAFRRWNLVKDTVRLRMPGGTAVAEFSDASGFRQTVKLSGPSVYIDTFEGEHALSPVPV